ncbi:MAG: hypothetical protein GEU82_17320 [Luteitalea sp.]|nr:hypothetical protein [Luteitalea sp.]
MTATRLLQGAALATVLVVSRPVAGHGQAIQRTVYVSALDQNGAPVSSLSPPDVVVREDNVAREVLSIARAVEPMHLALLVDNSQAAEPYIRDYREALPAFISAVLGDDSGAKHQISIVTLAERPTIITDYTTDAARLADGAGRLFAIPGSGTYLLDGLIEISQGIRKRNFSRPVIVAITTEGPEMSDRVYQSVLEPLRESGAAFHVIVVGNPSNPAYDRSIVLDQGTREGGGRYDTLLTGNALTSRLKQVAAELTHQFRVTYARPQTLIPPDRVTVASGREGLTVRGIAARDTGEPERRP